ncbi:hypothetical protein [Noviherbaspirillum denitrificans]|uniref:Uncharacterized protein n=1 Tax=Noviherbaspirillum denitrificans TaxID=1968433 RepID=A0A254TN47_9BURK|nr:hypothetical protein [Noviherbaspirillum denitrificans]OWW22043.1 hypothetical protein AYR66_23675 [Noviherbaspirillum denitrificans]
MRKVSLALFVSLLALSGAGYTQSQSPSPTSEIRESTDPARYDDVMRRAQEIQSRQSSSADMSSGSSDTMKKSGRHMKSKKHGRMQQGSSGSSGMEHTPGTPPDSGSSK